MLLSKHTNQIYVPDIPFKTKTAGKSRADILALYNVNSDLAVIVRGERFNCAATALILLQIIIWRPVSGPYHVTYFLHHNILPFSWFQFCG